MKRVIFSIVGLFVMSGLVLSCSSDDGADCPEDFSGALEANEEKLVGQWQLTAILADEAVDITDDDTENPSTNLFAQYNECQKDGVYTFNADRSYIFEQGQNGTNCQNKGTFEGTWQLSSNILGLIFSCNTQNLGVTFNGSDTAFSFSDDFNITDVSGNTIEANITFTYSLAE